MVALADWQQFGPDALRIIALGLITAGACGLTVVAFLVRHALVQRDESAGLDLSPKTPSGPKSNEREEHAARQGDLEPAQGEGDNAVR